MKQAKAVRKEKFTHTVQIRGGDHTLTADEPRDTGGDDNGPSPQELLAASLASCSAVTLEMYAKRKGWNLGDVTVEVRYEPAQRGSPTRFGISVTLPKELPEEQAERLMQIVARCPVHRTLEGEVIFDEKLQFA
jgi:putative redox protein